MSENTDKQICETLEKNTELINKLKSINSFSM